MSLALRELSMRRLAVTVCVAMFAGLICVDWERWQDLGSWWWIQFGDDLVLVLIALAALWTTCALAWVLVAAGCSIVWSGLLAIGVLRPPALRPAVLSVAEVAALVLLSVLVVALESGGRALVGLAVLAAAGMPILLRAHIKFAARDVLAMGACGGVVVLLGVCLRLELVSRRRAAAHALQDQRLAIARDLHDHSAQALTGIIVQAQALQRMAAGHPEVVVEALPLIEKAGQRALEDMRQLTDALRHGESSEARDCGWEEQLRAQCGRAVELGLPVTLPASLPRDVSESTGRLVCAVVGEALTNALRYAQDASVVRVEVQRHDDAVSVQVVDDGNGHSHGSIGGGQGIAGLAERARQVGGRLDAGPNEHGWCLRAIVPAGRPQ